MTAIHLMSSRLESETSAARKYGAKIYRDEVGNVFAVHEHFKNFEFFEKAANETRKDKLVTDRLGSRTGDGVPHPNHVIDLKQGKKPGQSEIPADWKEVAE